MIHILEGLNPMQQQAVLHSEGPLLIVAGAGAGKTKTITHRIAHLIENGVRPEQILAITFTNKAAKEMRERTASLLETVGVSTRPHFATFHSLGVLILREEGHRLGIPRHFSILDESGSMSFIKESMKKESIDPKLYEPKKIRGVISREKGSGRTCEEYSNEVGSGFGDIVASIWRQYERLSTREQALDFDDLLLKTWHLLDRYPDVREKYLSRWKYLHVDEYQDTNELQYRIVRLLTGPTHNICVVGDSDQNIYSWRGANLKNILHFEKDFPETTVVLLEENYRSTKNILAFANDIIRKNEIRVEKNLFTNGKEGEKITICECYDEQTEGDYIAKKAQEKNAEGIAYSDMAVLYRANFQSRALEEMMLRNGLPYQVLGTKFFDRKEIKDILSYIQASFDPSHIGNDMARIINVPTRGIGEKTFEKIKDGAWDLLPVKMLDKVHAFMKLLENIRERHESIPPSELIKYILIESGLEKTLIEGTDEDRERLENIRELVTVARRYDGETDALIHMLDDAALVSDQDTLMYSEGGIRLMTIHATKGLEFKVVFITGLEENLFPHSGFGERKSKEQNEEERRLMYVAVTRAKEKLYLTHAGIRYIYGTREIHRPSLFLDELSETLTEHEWRLTPESESGNYKTIFLD
ncbi:MAG: exodeoxyribonuclease V subunit gamma [Candidatus Pacebacteria bacterium]|nr:exodeoxyribonuclease V subunit gamma [Candidatus Paceibacterota bacterium]